MNKMSLFGIVGAIVVVGGVGTYLYQATQAATVKPCKAAVEEFLTSPGSAIWGEIETAKGYQRYHVRGQVDSQNGFGALKRQFFICRLEAGKAIRVAFSEKPFSDDPHMPQDARGWLPEWRTSETLSPSVMSR